MYSVVVQSETTLLKKYLGARRDERVAAVSIFWSVPDIDEKAQSKILIYFCEFIQQIYFPLIKRGSLSDVGVIAQAEAVADVVLGYGQRFGSVYLIDFTVDIQWESLGLAQGVGERGLFHYVRLANQTLRRRLSGNAPIRIIDSNFFWEGGRSPVQLEFFIRTSSCYNTSIAEVFCKQLYDILSKLNENPVKCICFDLDDTIWGGIAGDVDHEEQLVVGGMTPEGRAFEATQLLLKELKGAGFFLAIVSKNSSEVVAKVFRSHSGMVLDESDISVFELGFEDKSERIRRVARSLNIGLDAILFIDDNPAERELVKNQLPTVEVFDFPSSAVYLPGLIQKHPRLQKRSITAEDELRTKSLLSRINTKSERPDQVEIADVPIETEVVVRSAVAADFDRVFQLINKTNQFTTRGFRCTEKQLLNLMPSDGGGALVIVAEVSDRFAKYGITGVLVANLTPCESIISDVIVSCRVFGRGVEWKLIDQFKSIASRESKVALFTKDTGRNDIAIQFARKVQLRNPEFTVINGTDDRNFE